MGPDSNLKEDANNYLAVQSDLVTDRSAEYLCIEEFNLLVKEIGT